MGTRIADMAHRAGTLPLVEELTPGPAPWRAFLALSSLPRVLFLDSALRHPTLGRYSFLSADPFEWLQRRGPGSDPLLDLAVRLAPLRCDPLPGLPPFQGGAAGLFGYDLCHHLERLPRPRLDEFETPDLAVGLYDWVLSYDHEADRCWLVSTGFPETDPARRRQRAAARLRQVKEWLGRPPAPPMLPATPSVTPAAAIPVPCRPGLLSSLDADGYRAMIGRGVEYVHAGDCFQVNLAQRLLVPSPESAVSLYGRLRERNAAPFAGYLDLGDFVIASASPERFLRIEGGQVETRPIKGTRPSSADPAEDAARRAELLSSAKDRAENVMIVDLLRNDLGRVCRYGSVRVTGLCQLETYRFVHHLVSVVAGRLRDGLGPLDLLRAAFPGGSVTGAPKVRAMQIIAELEPTARGPYCGSLGYVGFDGTSDTNILIRTFTLGRGWAQFPVGGGIVADSVPDREYAETWHKAEGLLRALL